MVEKNTQVLVIGDGPTGLQAALLLAKNGADVDVYGENETKLHKALLKNYLGIKEMTGSDFVVIARAQAEAFGAKLHDGKVTSLESAGGGFHAKTSDGTAWKAQYVVIANGPGAELAKDVGLETADEDRVRIDRNGRTSVDHLYAGGWVARGGKIQVAISVGDGAAIALDILSREKGKDFHDFDAP